MQFLYLESSSVKILTFKGTFYLLTEIYSMASNPHIHHRTFDLQMMRLSRWVFWGAAWGVLWSRHTLLHNYLWNHVCWDWNSEHFEVLLGGSLKHMHSTSHPRYSWASYLFRSLSIGSTIPTLNYFLCTFYPLFDSSILHLRLSCPLVGLWLPILFLGLLLYPFLIVFTCWKCVVSKTPPNWCQKNLGKFLCFVPVWILSFILWYYSSWTL